MLKQTTKQGNAFSLYPASKRLHDLAKEVIDLSQPNQLTPERLKNYAARGCGFKLLYGTERVTDEVMQALSDLAQEAGAPEKMRKMQDGEEMNFVCATPSENRSVLHTAVRDFFDHPCQAKKAKEATHLAYQEIEKLKTWLSKIEREKSIDQMIVIGIGGSELGPRAHYEALRYLLKPKHQVRFIANVDPDDAAAQLNAIDLKRSVVVVISKSGTTLETATNEELVRARFKRASLSPEGHFIAITMPKTPMDDRKKYAEVFYLWDWIGGRYSTTSMVGGVILSFAFGFDVYREFLKGAHEMDRLALQSDLKKNLPLLAALIGIWNRNFLQAPTLAVIPYSQALHRYPAHLQQLDMESNGKSIAQQGEFVSFSTGPILWGEPGTNAQHSFFQLLHQGTQAAPLFMIGFKESQYGEDVEVEGTTSQEKLCANLLAQSLALALGSHSDQRNAYFPGNRPSHLLLGERLTPYALGALLAFYEHKVAFQGFIWGINSFDQEGVQLGKRLANQFLEQLKARPSGKEERAEQPLVEAYLEQLRGDI